MLGEKTAQVSLNFGVDDLDAPWWKSGSPDRQGHHGRQHDEEELIHLIQQADRIPVERDTVYNRIKVWK